MIRRLNRRIGRTLLAGFLADQRGQVALEYALILAAIAIPLLFVFRLCLRILVNNYRMVTFMNSMPFP